jgi:hypothetical protein
VDYGKSTIRWRSPGQSRGMGNGTFAVSHSGNQRKQMVIE